MRAAAGGAAGQQEDLEMQGAAEQNAEAGKKVKISFDEF